MNRAAWMRPSGAWRGPSTPAGTGGDPDVVAAEMSALITDRERLAEELDASLGRETELQALADEASTALGAAIEEVRAALGKEA